MFIYQLCVCNAYLTLEYYDKFNFILYNKILNYYENNFNIFIIKLSNY